MELFLPAHPLALVHVFAPYFTTPSLAYFQSSLWALMVVEGRKGPTRLARCVFFHQRDRSSWERFLAEHRGSVTAVTERLVRLVVERLGAQRPVPGASGLGTDPPLIAKTAQRLRGGQQGQDHSDNADRGAWLVGHPWHRVGLSSPWGARRRWWPLVAGPRAPRGAAMARWRRCRAQARLGCGPRGAPGGEALLGEGSGAGGGHCLLLHGAVSHRAVGARHRRDQPPAHRGRGVG